ncbi:MAG: GIY-YIG nuclease family protein [bacterium]|nr:GIY-YIG nuclease family protein [bacterium]
MIESQKNSDLYKGFTSNINNRLKEHNAGMNESTKKHRPWKLVYCEIFLDKEDAILRERYLKSGWGRGYLEKVLKNYHRNKK